MYSTTKTPKCCPRYLFKTLKIGHFNTLIENCWFQVHFEHLKSMKLQSLTPNLSTILFKSQVCTSIRIEPLNINLTLVLIIVGKSEKPDSLTGDNFV